MPSRFPKHLRTSINDSRPFFLALFPRTVLDSLLRNERAHEVRGGLNRLREVDRQTLIAFYFEGQSIKQMSDAANRPIGTIKRRLHTARNRLRDQLVETQPA